MANRLLRLVSMLLLLRVFACVDAIAEEAPIGKIDAFVELPKDAPYVGEPLRLVLRAAVHARVAKDIIVQPALTDFDWQQFGVDASGEELVDGFWMPVIQRVLMIYPLRAGRLTIEPFKRRVTYLIGDGERAEIEFISQPLTIDVRARNGVGDPADFWLPAKSLRITDQWEPEPDRIHVGETAKRTVTMEAEGVTADRLPPLPNFRAPGVITFAGPIERQTIVTDRGPIGRAVYQWKVRPVADKPAIAPAIRLRWFDISSRMMRETEAPERRVAFIAAKQEQLSQDPRDSLGFLASRPLVAALLAFVSTIAATYLAVTSSDARRASSRDVRLNSWRSAWRTRVNRWRLQRALRAAARQGDLAALRRILDAFARTDPDAWRRIAARNEIAPALATIDAALFGREPPTAPDRLESLAEKVALALRNAQN